jgi:hypothetical protein
MDFTARKKVDWGEVRELVDASFRLIAPKKLIKQLDDFETDVPKAIRSEAL